MRLEERDDAAVRVRLAGGRERRRDFGRVVRVVIDDDDAGALPLLLEAPDDAFEFLERARRDPERNRELARDRERSERVFHVVEARHPERDGPQELAAGRRNEARAGSLEHEVAHRDVGLGREPECDDPARHERAYLLHVRVVQAESTAPTNGALGASGANGAWMSARSRYVSRRWRSILLTSASMGQSARNDRSNSGASA